MSARRLKDYFNYYTGRAKFLFIHIPKNAGVAIRKCPELQTRLVSAEPAFHKSPAYTRRVKQVMAAAGEHHGIQHARLLDIHPRVRWALRPVAVIRNPWARVVSRYRFAELARTQGNIKADYVAGSFEEFLEERHIYGSKEFYWHRAVRGWYPQFDYVRDEEGRVSVHILRQEFLEEESRQYFQLRSPLERRNVSSEKPARYQSYYTPQTIQIVADWYVKDIEYFGFDFDTPAKRNFYCAASDNAGRRAA